MGLTSPRPPPSPGGTPLRSPAVPSRYVLPLIALAGLVAFALLYQLARPAYVALLSILMAKPYATPFVDLAQLPALVRCFHQGIDVYLSAPCDPLDRVFAYSPLLLRIPYLPSSPDALPYLGAGLTAVFAISLALLPPPRQRGSAALFAATLFSSLPVFALERGNLDVLMFILIATGTAIILRGGWARYAGYGLLGLAGLLKFYPMSLALLVARERASRAMLLLACLLGTVALFIWHFHAELKEMSRNLPMVPEFTDGFGGRQLAAGLLIALRGIAGNTEPFGPFLASLSGPSVGLVVFFGLGIGVITIAWRLAAAAQFRAALHSCTAEERLFLTVGATLIGACFLLLPNVGYRGIHLLFLLPGLASLALAPRAGWPRTLFRAAIASLLIATWGLTLQQIVAALSSGTAYPIGGSAACYIYWILHELNWWFLETILLAIVLAELQTSPLLRGWFGKLAMPTPHQLNPAPPASCSVSPR